MTSGNCNNLDGQHGSIVLDFESRKALEGIHRKPCQENSSDNGRSGNLVEALSVGKKHR